MLNNPPQLQPAGLLPSASSSTPDTSQYPFLGDPDYVGSIQHRWLVPFDIGVITYNGSNSIQVAQGLAVGQSMVVNVDQTPDKWIVVVWGEGASGAAANFGTRIARISLGPGPGGPGYQLGAGGKLKLPAQGFNYLTITNISTAVVTVHGTIIAVGGFDLSDIDVG
ncbi:MAG TPA: hypothetical protein VH593_29125 [Ktedonobacteraceae bacterium]|jgi:hypothetical protein